MSEKLSMDNLSEFDGGSVRELVDASLTEIYLDLNDRPGLSKSRKLLIEVECKPIADGNLLEEIHTVVKVKKTIPNRESRVNICAPSMREKGIMFDRHSRRCATAPGQQELDYDE